MSNTNCGCSTTTVTPCTSSSGCLSTNYAKCIYYSGTSLTDCVTITNGDNLDDVINALATAICNVTPEDLNWAGFDYGCYAGEGWSTAQEFAEGLTEIVCTIDAGSGLLPAGTTIPASAPSNIAGLTPGSSSIEETYEATFADLTAHELFNTDGAVVQGCFSTVPTATKLADWINWIRGNVCTIQTDLTTVDEDFEIRIADLETFVGSINLFDNTDCLGGSSTDNLADTMALVKQKICEIDSLVTGYPDFDNITMSWSSCVGLYPAYGNTASLTTQLGRLLTQLSKRTYTFSGDFTVSAGACGSSVSLATTVTPFSCGDLATCSIHNIGDVDGSILGTGSGDKYKVLSWDIGSQTWFPKPLSITSSGGTAAITPTDSGSALTYNVEVNITDGGNTDDTALGTPVDLVIGAASGGSRAISLKYNSNYFSSPVAGTFTPAPDLTASAYVTDGFTPYRVSGVVYMAGAYDWTPAAPVAGGAYATIGAVSSPLIPGTSNRTVSVNIVDTATDTGIPAIIQFDTSGNVQIRNVSGGALSSTYLIPLSGVSYVK